MSRRRGHLRALPHCLPPSPRRRPSQWRGPLAGRWRRRHPPREPPRRGRRLPPSRPRSLFSLIARAEAAELPPDFAVPRKKAAASTAIGGSAHPAAAPHTASPSRPVFVQAGAFANRSNALRAEARIARLGSVHVAAAAINGVAVYRVRLGPVGSHEQAKILLNRVVDSGFREARIVGD